MPLKHPMRVYVLKEICSARTLPWQELFARVGGSRSNVGAALKMLLDDGYIKKVCWKKKPIAAYEITESGRDAFDEYKRELW